MMETDEFGQFLCPLIDATMEYDAEGENQHRESAVCRQPLHLVLTGNIPVTADLEANYTFSDCICHGWAVECEHGHVLLRSAGEETAEPFTHRYLTASPSETKGEDA